MITVKLIGGLGNQLSQYAMGRHLALKNNTELLLDISSYETYKLHNYSLGHFQIQANFASKVHIPWYEIRMNNKYLDFILNKIKPSLRGRQHILEDKLLFDNKYLEVIGSNIYLEGYWQTEKYFSEIEDTIRTELQFKTPPSIQNQEIIDEIKTQKNAISIHIRRGDYIANVAANKIHGTCDMDYYARAVEYMRKHCDGELKFYIFSDDIPWAKENFILPFSTRYIDNNDASSNYEDLRLMGACAHNIIANSTFSWWGAWLNGNPDKIVVAPKKWFNTTKHPTGDIIPKKWIKL